MVVCLSSRFQVVLKRIYEYWRRGADEILHSLQQSNSTDKQPKPAKTRRPRKTSLRRYLFLVPCSAPLHLFPFQTIS